MRYSSLLSLLLASSLGLAACSSDGGSSGRGGGDLAPDDFVTPRQTSVPGESTSGSGTEPALERMNTAMEAARQGQIGVDVPVANPAAPPPPRPVAEPAPVPRSSPATPAEGELSGGVSGGATGGVAPAGDPLPLAGMVGQVNGQAIYANKVLEPISEQLATLGRELPPSQFRQRATELIRATLDQIVTDALILGEAERDLSDRERGILEWQVRQQREELLRKYGQGSLSLAEARLREESGAGLDQTLADFRTKQTIERHLYNTVIPRINVTRRDIERYYNDHPEEFNPQPKRTLRLIRVADETAAAEVIRRLDAGESFTQVASSDLNRNRPESGGLMETGGGEAVFDNPALNDALLKLQKGQHAGPVAVGQSHVFVYLEDIVTSEHRPLRDVQLDIERKLREDQYRLLSAQERQRLLQEGNYNPLDQMVDQLVRIATARYSTPTS